MIGRTWMVSTFYHKLRYIIKMIFWVFYGATVKHSENKINIRNILFICRGNICRSAFAEHYAIQQIQKQNLNQIIVDSAGVKAKSGTRSTETAVNAALLFGVKLNEHRAKELTYNQLQKADIIFVMEPWQSKFIESKHREFSGKIALLSLYDRGNKFKLWGWKKYNIEDPYGKSLETYRKCYERIINSITEFLECMKKAS